MSDFEIVDGRLTRYFGHDERVVIPDGVESIGDYAFRFRRFLKQVTIPDSVREIGNNAFESCSTLTHVYGCKNVRRIGENAFFYCSALEEFPFEEGLENIEICAFYACRRLKKAMLPHSLRQINYALFKNCDAIEDARLYTIEPGNLLDDHFRQLVCEGFMTDVVTQSGEPYSVTEDYSDYIKNNSEQFYEPAKIRATVMAYLLNEALVPLDAAEKMLNDTENPEIRTMLLEFIRRCSPADIDKEFIL